MQDIQKGFLTGFIVGIMTTAAVCSFQQAQADIQLVRKLDEIQHQHVEMTNKLKETDHMLVLIQGSLAGTTLEKNLVEQK